MTEMRAFLTRLSRIASDPERRDDSFARALELFDLFRRRLYARHDIRPSKRPTFRDKQQVDRALADLRQLILRAEVAATEANIRLMFTGIRHRIDMARRTLAAHIPRGSSLIADLKDAQHANNDWQLLSGIRERALRSRQIVLNSLEAIHQSRRLLGNSAL